MWIFNGGKLTIFSPLYYWTPYTFQENYTDLATDGKGIYQSAFENKLICENIKKMS